MSTSRTYQVEGSACEPLDSVIADIPATVIQVAAVKDGDKWQVTYILPVEPKGGGNAA